MKSDAHTQTETLRYTRTYKHKEMTFYALDHFPLSPTPRHSESSFHHSLGLNIEPAALLLGPVRRDERFECKGSDICPRFMRERQLGNITIIPNVSNEDIYGILFI